MNHSELCHDWANTPIDDLDNGRARRSTNISYQGRAIMSYHWWQMGWRFSANCVFIRTDNYSVSTSKHQSYLSSACSHLQRVYIPTGLWRDNGDIDFKAVADAYAWRIYEGMSKGDPYQTFNVLQLRYLVDEFGVRAYGAIAEYTSAEFMHRIEELIEIKRDEREAKREARIDTQVEQFKQGLRKTVQGSLYTYLRRSQDGEYIESSKGMTLNVNDCHKAVRKAITERENFKCDVRDRNNRIWVVSFDWERKEFRAGCHLVSLQQAVAMFKDSAVEWFK